MESLQKCGGSFVTSVWCRGKMEEITLKIKGDAGRISKTVAFLLAILKLRGYNYFV